MPESLDTLFTRLEELFDRLDQMPEPHRSDVYRLLDAVDDLHRQALVRIMAYERERMEELAESEPALAWLFRAYGLTPPSGGPTPVRIRSRRPH